MDLRVTSAEDFIIKLASPYLFIFKCDFDFLQILRLVGLGVEKIDASNQWSYVRTVHTGRRQAGRRKNTRYTRLRLAHSTVVFIGAKGGKKDIQVSSPLHSGDVLVLLFG